MVGPKVINEGGFIGSCVIWDWSEPPHPQVDLTYDYDHVGESTEVLASLADGSHPYCARLAKVSAP